MSHLVSGMNSKADSTAVTPRPVYSAAVTEPFLPSRTNQVPMIDVMMDAPPRISGNMMAFMAPLTKKSDPRNITATVVTA